MATSEMALPLASHLFLPKAIIIVNNHRGIPQRLLNAVITVAGCTEQRYMLLKHSLSAAIIREINFASNFKT